MKVLKIRASCTYVTYKADSLTLAESFKKLITEHVYEEDLHYRSNVAFIFNNLFRL